MRYLLDTGILLRLEHRSDPHHAAVSDALRRLVARGHRLVTARQNIVEFWSVSTRPSSARGGFGLSIEEVAARLRLLESTLHILGEPDSTYDRWKSLVTRHRVSGRQVHDARLVAVMQAYRVRHVLTLNGEDFARYPGIRPIAPSDVR